MTAFVFFRIALNLRRKYYFDIWNSDTASRNRLYLIRELCYCYEL